VSQYEPIIQSFLTFDFGILTLVCTTLVYYVDVTGAGDCTAAKNYGYDIGKPCVLLRFNRVCTVETAETASDFPANFSPSIGFRLDPKNHGKPREVFEGDVQGGRPQPS